MFSCRSLYQKVKPVYNEMRYTSAGYECDLQTWLRIKQHPDRAVHTTHLDLLYESDRYEDHPYDMDHFVDPDEDSDDSSDEYHEVDGKK